MIERFPERLTRQAPGLLLLEGGQCKVTIQIPGRLPNGNLVLIASYGCQREQIEVAGSMVRDDDVRPFARVAGQAIAEALAFTSDLDRAVDAAYQSLVIRYREMKRGLATEGRPNLEQGPGFDA